MQPHIAGILTCKDDEGLMFENEETSKQETFSSRLEVGAVTVRHGLIVNMSQENSQLGYLIDSDFFDGAPRKSSAVGCFDVLNKFNENARNLFRWCIRERLHEALVG